MLKTAEIFQDNMIVQREKPVIIWGQGTPGERVTAMMQGRTGETKARPDGSWRLALSPMEASEDETLRITSGAEEIIYTHVAVGEVWIGAGQSNMEFHMRYEKHRNEEFALPKNPRLRFYDVPEVSYDGQLDDFDYSAMGIWRQANREDLEYFSAVGYYFQKALENGLHVPVGIIGCNWGGTPSCAWMSRETVAKAGRPWMEDYENQIKDMDMEKYWQMQRTNPLNGRGTPFSDPFGEFVLPSTPTQEEVNKKMGFDQGEVPEYLTMMHSESIPGALYEHMVKKIAPYTVRGCLWYQGESDDVPGRQHLYKDMLTGLIGDWRALWQDDRLPFLVVQLPGWATWLGSVNMDYAAIRLGQQQAADTDSDVWLCSISDGGQENDIHPKDKKIVGQRLALLARGHVYGENILCDPPRPIKAEDKGSCIEITFENTGHGLITASGGPGDGTPGNTPIEALEVTARGKPVAYEAAIDRDKVILTLKEKAEGPRVVRFARGKWYKVNLYNSAGVPAIPFEIPGEIPLER